MRYYCELSSSIYDTETKTLTSTWVYYNLANMPPDVKEFVGTEAELKLFLESLAQQV